MAKCQGQSNCTPPPKQRSKYAFFFSNACSWRGGWILNFLTASILILPMLWNVYYYEVITMCITMNVYCYEDTIGINPSCLANICPL